MNTNKIPCAVYQDLLPLVQDGLASAESKALVEEHEKTCPYCGTNNVNNNVNNNLKMNETRILQKIKFQIISLSFIPLVIGIFVGVNFGITQYMFNNIWLMPLLGGLSTIIYKKKSLWLLLVVLVVSSLYHALPIHYNNSYELVYILASFQWGYMYSSLFFIGQVIVALLTFALKKEEDN